MKLTSQELFTIATVMGNEIDNIQQEIAKAQYKYLKGVLTETDKNKMCEHYNNRAAELYNLKQKVFNAAYAARFEEI